MALNPITYTEKVVGNFLRYQLTTYDFADTDLHEQLRQLLSLEQSRRTPLLKGPYFSLSRAFARGASVREMIDGGLFHPFMARLIPYSHLYQHQETAIRAIAAGQTTLVSTGTGSGKTEAFLYPIISRCLQLRDENAPAGITAVLVYPMNALAEDQLGRMRNLLAGTGITFGMYVGSTPEYESGVTGLRLPAGASKAEYDVAVDRAERERRGQAVHPSEERCSRQMMRTPGEQPRILLTNVKQLELLLTRQVDAELFDAARLEFLVFDEAHTFRGAIGAETACLIRRLRAFCGKDRHETTCVATSATIVDPVLGHEAGRQFATRFFGVDAQRVEVVNELYEADLWTQHRTVPPAPASPSELLKNVLQTVESEAAGDQISKLFLELTGTPLSPARWQEDLYQALTANEIIYQLAEYLKFPKPLFDVLQSLRQHVGRTVSEEELLIWLTLGAAARREQRPLLRPVVHAFLRGVEGAVVAFPTGSSSPKLYLSIEQEEEERKDAKLHPLPILTCRTCGQHYFAHHVKDFRFTEDAPGGGDAIENRRVWPSLAEAQGGKRVVLLDRLIESEDDDETPSRTAEIFFCRHCGALHPAEVDRCDDCGMPTPLVRLLAVQQREDRPGLLVSCISCKTPGGNTGGRQREPIRPIRATTVADVHVLAQEMLRHSERPRLLVFADNRQDAAFQAGWMKDHARRYRLRAMMWEQIKPGQISINDLIADLDERLERDDWLSQALVPEVWEVEPKAATGRRHAEERKYFLRIQVLREVVTGVKQRIGLEPWGRLRVQYAGLAASDAFITEYAEQYALSPERLLEGVSAILDDARRKNILYDPVQQIFSRFWDHDAREIARGYLPLLKGVPKGLKLQRDPSDDPARVLQWVSTRGATGIRQMIRAWGIPADEIDTFITALWKYLVEDKKVLTPVTLVGSRGRALPNCYGTYQVDVDHIYLMPHAGGWRCNKCRRLYTRPLPLDRCPTWRCDGTLSYEREDADNYDLGLLDSTFQMLRAREHSAQVPDEERELLERLFKGDGEKVNTLVCTPTLELGVDIGGLDAVLMRNVPPLPANYWQRAGRAGRRHRLAVNITYSRPASHDRFYFADPLRMLEGMVEPPSFNLLNPVMVNKHVHAAVLTRLHQLARENSGLDDNARQEIQQILAQVLPRQTRAYLFDERGEVRSIPLDVTPLHTLITRHATVLLSHVEAIFRQGWPEEDWDVVTREQLLTAIEEMTRALAEVVLRLKKRLDWAMSQIRRLDAKRDRRGSLEAEDEALFRRCDRLVKRYKGELRRQRRESEGVDDIATFGVLAAEGFLPGYGLEAGAIIGTANVPRTASSLSDFDLGRPPAMAIREYVPGNMIYANGHRFVPRYYHLDRQTETGDPLLFQVDTTVEAVAEIAAGPHVASMGSAVMRAVPMSDVDLAHISHISDDEDYRFQLQVAVYGHELGRHSGGVAYTWGAKTLLWRQGVHMRLVNVGPTLRVKDGRLGYPVCLVCGQSRSPLASKAELDHFTEDHQTRCQHAVEPTGFYTDLFADAISIRECLDRGEAYSVLETLRIGATRVLDMERDDLQIMVIGRPGDEHVDAILYDPMPGGSGLLKQIIDRFDEIVGAAMAVATDCPSSCDAACNDCLCTYRNAHVHRFLNRHLALQRLHEWGAELQASHEIPAHHPASGEEMTRPPINEAEAVLRGMLSRAGFPEPIWHQQLTLGRPLGTTSPDCYFPADDEDDPGVCIYLDGLSQHIHGNPDTRERDRQIREQLRALGYEVVEIAASDLTDQAAMRRHFYRLGKYLLGRERAETVKQDTSWFVPNGSNVMDDKGPTLSSKLYGE